MCAWSCQCSLLQSEDKKADQGSLEDLSKEKGMDEPDRAQPRSPQPSEPVGVQRRSPLIRNRKTGSMEVLSESSSKGYRLFSTYSRQASEMKQSGLGNIPGFCFGNREDYYRTGLDNKI
ncbi:inositol hexakisphosphate and diphosphoinositol-pentakisphosphate kinase 1-like isoform X1 [Meleagris gallopavo]|uniref:inositol hexakisphosphate and diphosphoinositol-pentakisphosphate kinase 1-like isoform X1 n=1 Tax=Meleagris gallopavo TaxID=9103 RepID=UPI000549B6CF|nr:inositol hexakisphosphate and diphosphoinositol-pentakisphosphate kinase 1-like isoform X1 [Meleagris gallopavo]